MYELVSILKHSRTEAQHAISVYRYKHHLQSGFTGINIICPIKKKSFFCPFANRRWFVCKKDYGYAISVVHTSGHSVFPSQAINVRSFVCLLVRILPRNGTATHTVAVSLIQTFTVRPLKTTSITH